MVDMNEIKEMCKKRQGEKFNRKNCLNCPYYIKECGWDSCIANEALAYGVPFFWNLDRLENIKR